MIKLARSRPAGNRIRLRRVGGGLPEFPGYRIRWLESGTAALALAMQAARRTRPWCVRPQVVLPAYACPDLVTAAVYAGLEPVLADIGANDPGYQLETLEYALNSRTVAIVAVNFLGISERLPELRAQINRFGDIALIEDNAQWFPPLNHTLSGDYVCLSFGRGKPVSVLGGGALLCRAGSEQTGEAVDCVKELLPGRFRGRWEVALYNALLRPLPYGIVSRLPGTRLGITRLEQLREIRACHPDRLAMLPANLVSYFARSREVEKQLSSVLSKIPLLGNLHAAHKSRAKRMLRMPILLPTTRHRNMALKELLTVGIGATELYGAPLIDIPGVRAVASQPQEAPGAREFSGRLLTLPIHEDVGQREIQAVHDVLAAVIDR